MKKIIYDIGSNDGKNIEYFLKKSDIVVAIDANPLLIENIKNKFSNYIKGKKLFVENYAIYDQDDLYLNFFIHKNHNVLSTIIDIKNSPEDKDIKNYYTIKIKSKKISSIISKYGEPYYIKIDIEGADHLAINDLYINNIHPEYISSEIHDIRCVDLILKNKKYNYFNLVEGSSVNTIYNNTKILVNNKFENFNFQL